MTIAEPASTPSFGERLADARATVLLPQRAQSIPPATARRLRAWSAAYLAAAALAILAAVLAPEDDALRAVAAGLPFPGGGLLATGHPWLAAIVVASVLIGIFLWWAIGTAVLPPALWVGGAAWAAALGGSAPSNAGLVFAVAAFPSLGLLTYVMHRVRHARQRKIGAALNAQLERITFPISGTPTGTRTEPGEHTADDLQFQRHALDLALQPLDRFDGFVKYDQYREAALRYQVYLLGYALSMSQYTRTPAFSGYLAEAQRGAIEKAFDRRVWGYWATENAWGRMSLRRDPVDTTGNIMLTGYYGTQLGMYETLNDDRYSAPGALAFRWSDDEEYRHDFGSVAASVHRNVVQTDFALFPCEPNWIYTVCNAFGLGAMVTHDRLHGTSYMEEVGGRLHDGYETEFLRPDGRIIGVRSKHTGLSWNFWTGTAIQLTTAYWLHPSFPDLAQRTWWLLRRSLRVEDGLLILPKAVSNALDPGNYVLGNNHYAMTIAEVAARELGDDEIAEAARRALDATGTVLRQDGAARYDGMSTFTSMYTLLTRVGRPSGLRDLIAFGAPQEWAIGPRLAHVAYPDVLVARAANDGTALDLVLRPGSGPVRTVIEVDRLAPGRGYVVDGLAGGARTMTADATGSALLSIDLGDRLSLRVRPG